MYIYKYSVHICLLCMIKRVRWCTCSLWRTLGKLIGLLYCLPSSLLLFVENSKDTRNELARPVMGTIFLVMKYGVISLVLCISIRLRLMTILNISHRQVYVCRGPNCVGEMTWPKHAHAQSQFWAVKIDR